MVRLFFGSFLGVPVIPPYLALGLIPYIVPHLGTWRHRRCGEKDFIELVNRELG